MKISVRYSVVVGDKEYFASSLLDARRMLSVKPEGVIKSLSLYINGSVKVKYLQR